MRKVPSESASTNKSFNEIKVDLKKKRSEGEQTTQQFCGSPLAEQLSTINLGDAMRTTGEFPMNSNFS